jgi:putative lipoic acid-binding regulatory protein
MNRGESYRIATLTLKTTPYPFGELCLILSMFCVFSPDYKLLGEQCYWFADVVFKAVHKRSPSAVITKENRYHMSGKYSSIRVPTSSVARSNLVETFEALATFESLKEGKDNEGWWQGKANTIEFLVLLISSGANETVSDPFSIASEVCRRAAGALAVISASSSLNRTAPYDANAHPSIRRLLEHPSRECQYYGMILIADVTLARSEPTPFVDGTIYQLLDLFESDDKEIQLDAQRALAIAVSTSSVARQEAINAAPHIVSLFASESDSTRNRATCTFSFAFSTPIQCPSSQYHGLLVVLVYNTLLSIPLGSWHDVCNWFASENRYWAEIVEPPPSSVVSMFFKILALLSNPQRFHRTIISLIEKAASISPYSPLKSWCDRVAVPYLAEFISNSMSDSYHRRSAIRALESVLNSSREAGNILVDLRKFDLFIRPLSSRVVLDVLGFASSDPLGHSRRSIVVEAFAALLTRLSSESASISWESNDFYTIGHIARASHSAAMALVHAGAVNHLVSFARMTQSHSDDAIAIIDDITALSFTTAKAVVESGGVALLSILQGPYSHWAKEMVLNVLSTPYALNPVITRALVANGAVPCLVRFMGPRKGYCDCSRAAAASIENMGVSAPEVVWPAVDAVLITIRLALQSAPDYSDYSLTLLEKGLVLYLRNTSDSGILREVLPAILDLLPVRCDTTAAQYSEEDVPHDLPYLIHSNGEISTSDMGRTVTSRPKLEHAVCFSRDGFKDSESLADALFPQNLFLRPTDHNTPTVRALSLCLTAMERDLPIFHSLQELLELRRNKEHKEMATTVLEVISKASPDTARAVRDAERLENTTSSYYRRYLTRSSLTRTSVSLPKLTGP